MGGDLSDVMNFLNKHNLSAGDTILISVVSGIILTIATVLLKPCGLKLLGLVNQAKAYVKKLIRWIKGEPNFDEIIALQQKKKDGEELTARENEILSAHDKRTMEYIKKTKLWERLPK
ncbi:MAG: hypothetical protein GX956_06435 [Firmicutes bacterium]|nr:hypothetical protein [Bacillota bacterium]